MLERLKQQVSPYLQARRWLIAYSGGLDSHVLLHLMATLARENPGYPPLVAIHVNHQIQSVANQWEEHCRSQANNLGIGYISCRVNVDSTRNIEQNARDARYKVFHDELDEGDCIFMAHHQLDNLETFFYRLFRGAGIKGLSGMPAKRQLGKGLLVRPLLSVGRDSLEKYAIQHQLTYVNDPSNLDVSFDRNYIRRELLPVIDRRWPKFHVVWQRLLQHFVETESLLDELAMHDLQMASPDAGLEPSVSLDHILLHSRQRQKNLLRYWLSLYGLGLSSAQTEELLEKVVHAGTDAMPLLLLGNVAIRRYRSRLYITREDRADFTEFNWNGLHECHVPGYGVLALSRPMDIDLQIRKRQGGEVIKPVASQHTRKLKNLLQELAIPYWRREQVPLVYCNGTLLAVADLVRAEEADIHLPETIIVKLA